MDRFERTELLIGEDNLELLKHKSVIVFGVGGVGSFAAEALARCGIGRIALVDKDTVSKSNINRQIIALSSTVGKPKVSVMADRIKDINPNCTVTEFHSFYTKNKEVDISGYDYVIDAIDTVTSKIVLIEEASRLSLPIISCMGTGNKLCPEKFQITDIYKTSVCPLAKVMRKELKARGIKKLTVLYSEEEPKRNSESGRIPASISFVPSVAGLMIAGEVVKSILKSGLK